MKVRPLQDRVIVKRIAEEEKSRGGIIIPDTAKEKPGEGEVIAVGSGKANEKGQVRRDDLVTFEVMVETLDRDWWRQYREQLARRFRQQEIVMRASSVELL